MSQPKKAPNILKLADLSRQIAALQARRSTVARQHRAAKRKVLADRVRRSYRLMQQAMRKPSRSFELWPLGVMLAGPLIPAGVATAVVHAATGSGGLAAMSFIVVAAACAAGLWCVFFLPDSAQLPTLIERADRQLKNAQDEANSIRGELSNVDHELHTTTQQRNEIQQSVQYKRELLLEQNWKAMSGAEWEAFLAKAFWLLGGTVEATGRRGDQGVDLVVRFHDRRYAIQAKGRVKSVGNNEVQQAIAGMAHDKCDRCAIITNSGFTAGAIALAKNNGCMLVGPEQIPSLVLGELPIA